ncbi:MAG: hypothetical protein RL885_28735 [Planctomycetota bacterium]
MTDRTEFTSGRNASKRSVRFPLLPAAMLFACIVVLAGSSVASNGKPDGGTIEVSWSNTALRIEFRSGGIDFTVRALSANNIRIDGTYQYKDGRAPYTMQGPNGKYWSKVFDAVEGMRPELLRQEHGQAFLDLMEGLRSGASLDPGTDSQGNVIRGWKLRLPDQEYQEFAEIGGQMSAYWRRQGEIGEAIALGVDLESNDPETNPSGFDQALAQARSSQSKQSGNAESQAMAVEWESQLPEDGALTSTQERATSESQTAATSEVSSRGTSGAESNESNHVLILGAGVLLLMAVPLAVVIRRKMSGK